VIEDAMLTVWVVSLEESVDRRIEVARSLHDIDLPFQFFPAVDGCRLCSDELRSIYSEEDARRAIGRPMTAGEIGCSLSHLAVYQGMIEANLDGLVVLEDDARAEVGLRFVLERMNQWPHDWEVMYLYHLGNDANHISLRGRSALGSQHRIVRFSDRPLGTVAYAIRASAARKMLRAGFPVSAPADELLNGYAIPVDLHRYGIHPVVVEHTHPDASHLAVERTPANAAVHASTPGLHRLLPDSVYRRCRRFAKSGKRFFKRYIV
jgi:glycosyl transferase family 25